eukprot:COSAG01_NODE_7005_length_3395_cov_9.621056_1_plen_205_part_00
MSFTAKESELKKSERSLRRPPGQENESLDTHSSVQQLYTTSSTAVQESHGGHDPDGEAVAGNGGSPGPKNSAAEAVETIKKLNLAVGSRPSAGESRQLKDALTTWMRGTALDHAVIIPFVCRLAREGPGGWEVPLVSDVMATMEKLRIPLGTADDEVTKIRQQVIDEMAKMGFICSPMPNARISQSIRLVATAVPRETVPVAIP